MRVDCSIPARARAFTLIELLVVIAIIAILAAMLMPALSKAKQRGYTAVDLNNLRQLNMSVHLTTADNSDVMPWANWLSGEIDTFQQGWLYALDPTASGPAKFKVRTGGFWEILQSQNLYFCPRDNTNSALFQMRGQQISSYVMNGAVCGYGRITTPVKLARLRPDGVAFWECADNTVEDNQTLFNDGSSSPDENVSARHGKVAIYGAFDGSAQTMLMDTWLDKIGGTEPNELWCYPNSPDGK